MMVWMVTYDDLDYYCEGNHIVGLYTTEELARQAIEAHQKERGDAHKKWSYDYTVSEWPIFATPILAEE